MRNLFKRIKRWYYRRKVAEAARILEMLDKTFILAGYARQDRRRFWRLLIKDRSEAIKTLKEISFSGPSDRRAGVRVGRSAGNK